MKNGFNISEGPVAGDNSLTWTIQTNIGSDGMGSNLDYYFFPKTVTDISGNTANLWTGTTEPTTEDVKQYSWYQKLGTADTFDFGASLAQLADGDWQVQLPFNDLDLAQSIIQFEFFNETGTKIEEGTKPLNNADLNFTLSGASTVGTANWTYEGKSLNVDINSIVFLPGGTKLVNNSGNKSKALTVNYKISKVVFSQFSPGQVAHYASLVTATQISTNTTQNHLNCVFCERFYAPNPPHWATHSESHISIMMYNACTSANAHDFVVKAHRYMSGGSEQNLTAEDTHKHVVRQNPTNIGDPANKHYKGVYTQFKETFKDTDIVNYNAQQSSPFTFNMKTDNIDTKLHEGKTIPSYNEGDAILLGRWYWTQPSYESVLYILLNAPYGADRLSIYSYSSEGTTTAFDGAFVCGYDKQPADLTLSDVQKTHIMASTAPDKIPKAKIHFVTDGSKSNDGTSVNLYTDDNNKNLQFTTKTATKKGVFTFDISGMDQTFLLSKANDNYAMGLITDLGFKFWKATE